MEENCKKTQRKEVDVIYVSDEDVYKIIKPFGAKTGRKSKEIGEPCTFKGVTRSGRKVTTRVSSTLMFDSNEEEEEIDLGGVHEKPSALFGDEDIIGSEIVGFHTPRRRDAMVAKASESNKKASSNNKKKKCSVDIIESNKTPFTTRAKIKRRIVKEVDKLKEDLVFEDSGSEYSPSESEEESESSSDSDIKPLDEVDNVQESETPLLKFSNQRRRGADSKYIISSEDYFIKHSSKALTSDHTLAKLKTPRLGSDELITLLKSVKSNHQDSIKLLDLENRRLFRRWLLTLREGYNILLYGLGSKRSLLNRFYREHLKNSPVLVVNGFFPGLTLKEILDGVACELLGLENVPAAPHEAISLIESTLLAASTVRIFLIIHNLDGCMLRNEKVQMALSKLVKVHRVHVLATVDHINSPLLWDQNKLSCYNFVWEDATSFLPYAEETSYESSIMIKRTGSLALSALKNVYQSLTTNSRSIFLLLLKFQLGNTNKNLGMHFSELYHSCRDAFIVSSDLALRTQLTEFIDHELIKWRKDTDHLIIPIDTSVLKQFLQEISGDEE